MASATGSRGWPVLLGGAVALTLVAGAGRWLGHANVHSTTFADASGRGLSDGARLLFVLMLVVGFVGSFAAARGAGSAGMFEGRPRKQKSLLVSIAFGLSYMLAVLLLIGLLARVVTPDHPSHPAGGASSTGTVAHHGGYGLLQDWPVLLGIVLVGALALVGWWLLQRAHRAVPRPPVDLGPPDGAASGGVTPYDPQAEHDPRRAVVGLYQWLLVVLGIHGRGRAEWEAPVEHVERVLAGDALTAGRTVADAFELARYSDHEVSEALRADAVAAARAVVDHVESQARGTT